MSDGVDVWMGDQRDIRHVIAFRRRHVHRNACFSVGIPSYLRTFAPKSSYGEIFFICRLELGHKVLTLKMKKKMGGYRLCFGENGSGKMP